MTEPQQPATIQRQHFEEAYSGRPPWDIGKPQPAFRSAAGSVSGSILDAGCGTGENALFFAGKGHAVIGIDFVEAPIAAAKRKAVERGLTATFLVKSALTLSEWSERFDNVIDSGLFHVFSDEDRLTYVRGLHTILRPGGHIFLLCFSEQTPGTQGPRRVTQQELHRFFAQGFAIESIDPVTLEIRPEALAIFAGEAPKGWFMVASRAA